jgi:hypothetical protein
MKRATPLELLPAEMFSGSYFTEPCRAWWGEDWKPIIQTEKRSSSEASRASSEARDRLIEQGRRLRAWDDSHGRDSEGNHSP